MRRARFIHLPTALIGLALLGMACNENVPLGTIMTTPVTGSGGSKGPDGSVDAGADSDSGTDGTGATDADVGPGVLWISTFETGDLSEWTADGAGGGQVQNAKLAPTASVDLARRGRFAGKFTVTTLGTMQTANYLYREAPNPKEAYYGAWFYIPSTIVVKTWLSLHHFNLSPTGDGLHLDATWDLNLVNNTSGGLVAQLYDYNTDVKHVQAVPVPVPRDTWVHFEMLFVKASTPTGRVALWQDDVLIVDAPNVVTVPNDWLQWNAGAAADGIEPSTAVVYVDDATISTSRVGSAPLP